MKRGEMIYRKEFRYVPVYEYVSSNQHGERYKRTGTKTFSICIIVTSDPSEHKQLIILGSTLDVPVRFDFKSQEAYLELASGEELKNKCG